MRRAISVTLDEDNWLWLKGQAAANARGNVSAVLDRLVTVARGEGGAVMQAMKSVAGTIDLPADDSDLAGASAYVRGLFDHALRRPMVLKEDPPAAPRTRRNTKRRG